VTKFYVPELVAHVGAVLDALEAQEVGRRFLLMGLCSGGYWAFQSAVRDERVSAALLVKSAALVWEDALVERREGRKVARLHQLVWWRRILRGDVTLARMRAVAGAYVRRALDGRSRSRGAPEAMSIEQALDRLRDAGTTLGLAFSSDEPLYAELRGDGIFDQLQQWPNIALETLPGGAHTLRPIGAQRAFPELIDRHLAHELARVETAAAAPAAGRDAPVLPLDARSA
jgi:hypothetical protein